MRLRQEFRMECISLVTSNHAKWNCGTSDARSSKNLPTALPASGLGSQMALTFCLWNMSTRLRSCWYISTLLTSICLRKRKNSPPERDPAIPCLHFFNCNHNFCHHRPPTKSFSIIFVKPCVPCDSEVENVVIFRFEVKAQKSVSNNRMTFIPL